MRLAAFQMSPFVQVHQPDQPFVLLWRLCVSGGREGEGERGSERKEGREKGREREKTKKEDLKKRKRKKKKKKRKRKKINTEK